MKLSAGVATLEAIDEHELPRPPIESDTARDIGFLLVAYAEERREEPPALLLAFLAAGAIKTDALHSALCVLATALDLDSEDWVLVNALIRHIEWCGDREGAAGWRYV